MPKELTLTRYHLKNTYRGVYLGSHGVGSGEHFYWFVTDESIGRETIGIVGKEKPGMSFIEKILTSSGDLVLVPRQTHAALVRRNIGGQEEARMTETENPAQMVELIRGLGTGRLKYVFYSSTSPDGSSPSVLTFSPTPPSEDLYKKSGPIKIDLSKREK